MALDYDYAQEHYWRFIHDRALALAELAPGLTVLDAACGTGAATLPAAERVRPGGRVLAVDFAPEMLALAAEKASRRALLNIDWRLEDLAALDLPPASCDVVLCLLALHVMPDMAATVAALWRLVRPGGRLVVATPGRPSLAPLYDCFYAAARAAAPELAPPRPWQRADSPARLRAVFEAAGVAVVISAAVASAPLRDSGDWPRLVRATGLCRTAQLLGPAAAARVAAANAETIAAEGIDHLVTRALFALAEKPPVA